MGIRKILDRVIACCWLGLLPLAAMGDAGVSEVQTYRSQEAFLAETLADPVPERHMLWVGSGLREVLRRSIGWEAPLRVPYWQQGDRTVWILDEIGKDQPITAGVVIDTDGVDRVEVLVFRESRGWEIRFPFFTDQFRNVRLTAGNELDAHIDGITGATLSVRAMQRMTRAALKMDAEVRRTRLARQ